MAAPARARLTSRSRWRTCCQQLFKFGVQIAVGGRGNVDNRRCSVPDANVVLYFPFSGVPKKSSKHGRDLGGRGTIQRISTVNVTREKGLVDASAERGEKERKRMREETRMCDKKESEKRARTMCGKLRKGSIPRAREEEDGMVFESRELHRTRDTQEQRKKECEGKKSPDR